MESVSRVSAALLDRIAEQRIRAGFAGGHQGQPHPLLFGIGGMEELQIAHRIYHRSVRYDAGRIGDNGATHSHPYFKTLGPVSDSSANNSNIVRLILRFK